MQSTFYTHTPTNLGDDQITSGFFFFFQDISLAVKESTAAHLEAIKIKYEEAVELRVKAEFDMEAFRPADSLQLATISLSIKLMYHLKFTK